MATEITLANEFLGGFAGGVVGAIIALGIAVVLMIGIGVYVYTSLALMSIFKQRKVKQAWLAWIPIANMAVMLQLGGFHWAWIFLILIPILGWIPLIILFVVANWRIFESLNYPGWLSLSLILDYIPGISGIGGLIYLIVIGFVAWKPKRKTSTVPKKSRKKSRR